MTDAQKRALAEMPTDDRWYGGFGHRGPTLVTLSHKTPPLVERKRSEPNDCFVWRLTPTGIAARAQIVEAGCP